MNRLRRGLYLVTPDEPDCDRLLARISPLLAEAACLQYRNKAADADLRLQQARALRAMCAGSGVPLIINDDVELAAAIDADGVHLGEHDAAIDAARARLGATAIIGVSCYDELARAQHAAAAGADYVAFGAFYPTTTKPSNYRPDPSILTWWSTVFEIPCVAIGGINPDNAHPLVEAGADFLAVCQAVWGNDDPRAAVQAFAEVLS